MRINNDNNNNDISHHNNNNNNNETQLLLMLAEAIAEGFPPHSGLVRINNNNNKNNNKNKTEEWGHLVTLDAGRGDSGGVSPPFWNNNNNDNNNNNNKGLLSLLAEVISEGFPHHSDNNNTGWSKETVDCKISLTEPKKSKTAQTQWSLETPYREVLALWCPICLRCKSFHCFRVVRI